MTNRSSYSLAGAILVIILFRVGFYLHNAQPNCCKPKGTIIILNGPSASGKTTMQKEFQKIMPDFYIRLGIDGLFDAVLPDATDPSLMVKKDPTQVDPKRYFNEGIDPQDWARVTTIYDQSDSHGNLIRAGIGTTDAQGHPLFILKVGSLGNQVIHGMHRAIAAYADAGNNVIVDYILYDQAWLTDLVSVLEGYTVYFVGVRIPLETLELREKARATSPVGHARSHYDVVHLPGIYDCEIDTGTMMPQEAAAQIKSCVESMSQPDAFARIKKEKIG